MTLGQLLKWKRPFNSFLVVKLQGLMESRQKYTRQVDLPSQRSYLSSLHYAGRKAGCHRNSRMPRLSISTNEKATDSAVITIGVFPFSVLLEKY